MAYRAVVFDLDGTLVHTSPEYRYGVVGQALGHFGIGASGRDIDRFWFGPESDNIIREAFGLDPRQFWESYHECEDPGLRRRLSRAYDDVDFIDELRERGFRTGMVTGAPPGVAQLEVEIAGRERFDAVVLARQSEGIRPKPDPHGIEECLKQLRVQRDEAVYVGNTDDDLMMARRAGVFDVLLLRGEHEPPKTEPSLTIGSLYEMRKIPGM